MRISERVRELCAQSGLLLRNLEERAGLETGYLCRMLEGQEVPSCDILGRLAVVFEVPFERLFYKEDEIVLTSKLTPRPTLEQLAQDCSGRKPAAIVVLSKLSRLLGLV